MTWPVCIYVACGCTVLAASYTALCAFMFNREFKRVSRLVEARFNLEEPRPKAIRLTPRSWAARVSALRKAAS